jgi:hypothetical protein
VSAQIIDIKLNCQIAVTTTYSNGAREQEQLSEIFDVYQNAKHLIINSTTNNFASVNTGNLSGYSYTNLSDENKWDLTNEKPGRKSQIIIVRNTGQIFYQRYFKGDQGLSMQIQGSGNCRKIDTDKKLF